MYEKVFSCIGSFADRRDHTKSFVRMRRGAHRPVGIVTGVSRIMKAAVWPISRDAKTRQCLVHVYSGSISAKSTCPDALIQCGHIVLICLFARLVGRDSRCVHL